MGDLWLLALVLAPVVALAAAPAQDGDAEARIFLDTVEAGLHRFFAGYNLEYWNFYTTGDPGKTELYEKLKADLLRDERALARVRALRERTKDAVLSRRLELLHDTYLGAQVEAVEAIYKREQEQSEIHIKHRARFDGREATDNELFRVLQFDAERARRESAWRAGGEVGEKMAPGLKELIAARNREARARGYPNFWTLKLRLQQVDEKSLDELLARLETLSEKPYLAFVETLRGKLGVARLEPWDLSFDVEGVQAKLRVHLKKELLLPRLRETFAAMGMDLAARPVVVDAEERPGKSQHAYAFGIDPPRDVRVLANADDGLNQHLTLFHEFGHAVYYTDLEQPDSYLLREAASSCLTEGVANFFSEVIRDPGWLVERGGVPSDLAAETERVRRERAILGVRASLMSILFEREAYRGRARDLNALYWKTWTRLLGVAAHPESRRWAGTIHFSTHPAYLPNYLLADMIASQLKHTLRSRLGAPLHSNARLGAHLRETVFRHGAALPWERVVEQASGEALDPKYYLMERIPESK
jgi:peptidyl-dipeptidase A